VADDVSGAIEHLRQLHREERALDGIVTEATDKGERGKAASFRFERQQRLEKIAAAFPHLLDIAEATEGLKLDGWFANWSEHPNVIAINEALARLDNS
jgi:hypothetical protein